MILVVTSVNGVILLRTGDVLANTMEPVGELAGSGWQYEGKFGDFLGTTIAPHFFITAKHIGKVSDKFIFHGADFAILRFFDDPASDLRIYEVTETFTLYAPLYTKSDEVGRNLVVIGRGTQRGPTNVWEGKLRGWNAGPSDLAQRWGENQVTSITQTESAGDMLYALFDRDGLPNEADLSAGDSGGAVFIKDGDEWKLAGINYDIDTFFSGKNGGGPFDAALFDQRGRYRRDSTLITGALPVPSGFYASRVSSKVAWIGSILKSQRR